MLNLECSRDLRRTSEGESFFHSTNINQAGHHGAADKIPALMELNAVGRTKTSKDKHGGSGGCSHAQGSGLRMALETDGIRAAIESAWIGEPPGRGQSEQRAAVHQRLGNSRGGGCAKKATKNNQSGQRREEAGHRKKGSEICMTADTFTHVFNQTLAPFL